MTTTLPTNATEPVKIRAHGRSVKQLGAWTQGRRLDVAASRGAVVLDLILPTIEPGDIEIRLDLDHSSLKLLVPDGAIVVDDELRRVGRGRVKDWTGTAGPDGRRIVLVGELRSSEVRIHRGGVGILTLLANRESRGAVRQAHREGRLDDAAREHDRA